MMETVEDTNSVTKDHAASTLKGHTTGTVPTQLSEIDEYESGRRLRRRKGKTDTRRPKSRLKNTNLFLI